MHPRFGAVEVMMVVVGVMCVVAIARPPPKVLSEKLVEHARLLRRMPYR